MTTTTNTVITYSSELQRRSIGSSMVSDRHVAGRASTEDPRPRRCRASVQLGGGLDVSPSMRSPRYRTPLDSTHLRGRLRPPHEVGIGDPNVKY